MIRLIRLALYFLIGLLLGAGASFAFADVVGATLKTGQPRADWFNTYGYGGPDGNAACVAYINATGPDDYTAISFTGNFTVSGSQRKATCTATWRGIPNQTWSINANWYCPSGTPTGSVSAATNPNDCGAYTCPAGYDGPKTVGGQPNMCEQLDKCASTKDKSFSGWVVKPAGGYSGVVCIDGCQYDQMLSIDTSNPQDERIGKDGRIWGPVSQYGKGTSCGGSTPEQGQPDQNNKQAKPPVCGATEGVMTTSSGKVLCVPEGTPDARKPDVEKKTKVETAPNGDKVTTESTTTTDPQTNAKQTNTTTTTTTSAGTSVSTSTATSSGNVGTSGGAAGGGSCTGENCTDNASKGKFGEYGELWKKKYPDGVSKVVTDKVTEMKQSNLGKLIADLAPVGIGSSGTCPSWTFDANIGHRMNFGSGSYAPPCWLWTALRAVFLITALFMARRIIFGG